jgi:hypothetical protein
MSAAMVVLAAGMLRAQDFIDDDHVKPVLPTKWSQLVDVINGYDVRSYAIWDPERQRILPRAVVADDWMCMDGQPITDLHWWGSYIRGAPGGATHQGGVMGFEISMHADIPAAGLVASHPGALLRSIMVPVGLGDNVVHEDFYTRTQTEDIYQYTVTASGPEYYIPQEQGKIYWLDIIGIVQNDNTIWGWHTAVRPGPLDAAVTIADYDPVQGTYYWWASMYDEHCSLQMAYELTTTPEPATIGLVGTAGLMLAGILYRRKMR